MCRVVTGLDSLAFPSFSKFAYYAVVSCAAVNMCARAPAKGQISGASGIFWLKYCLFKRASVFVLGYTHHPTLSNRRTSHLRLFIAPTPRWPPFSCSRRFQPICKRAKHPLPTWRRGLIISPHFEKIQILYYQLSAGSSYQSWTTSWARIHMDISFLSSLPSTRHAFYSGCLCFLGCSPSCPYRLH